MSRRKILSIVSAVILLFFLGYWLASRYRVFRAGEIEESPVVERSVPLTEEQIEQITAGLEAAGEPYLPKSQEDKLVNDLSAPASSDESLSDEEKSKIMELLNAK